MHDQIKTCLFFKEIHRAIVDNRLFSYGESIAIGASGGKDSTVLAHILKVRIRSSTVHLSGTQ
jgi:tRNA(Ile)-lysidine synthase TilS/MesJ